MRAIWYRLFNKLHDESPEIQADIDRLEADGGGHLDLRGREFLIPKLRIPRSIRVISDEKRAALRPVPLAVIMLTLVGIAIWSLLR